MATDGPDPESCNPELLKRGEGIAVLALPDGCGAIRFEQLVKRASQKAGVPIDWHFVGGRARVLAFPEDVIKANVAMEAEVYHVLTYGSPVGTIPVRDERPE